MENQGKLLEALDYQNRAYKIFVDIDEKLFTFISLYVIANLHLKLGNFEEAIKFADESTRHLFCRRLINQTKTVCSKHGNCWR